MRSSFSYTLLLAFATLALAAQTPASNSSVSPMRAIYVQDQRDRGVPLADNGTDELSSEAKKKLAYVRWEDVAKHDETRRIQVAEMLKQGKLVTGEDFHDASFIFQHGQTTDDYLLAHALAMEAMVRGDASAKWIAAATLDRYLQQIGQQQIFGTQYLDTRLAYSFQHQKDPDFAVKIKEITPQPTQLPYNEALLPAVTRKDFCVPELSLQQKYIGDAIAGKSPAIPRVPGCQH